MDATYGKDANQSNNSEVNNNVVANSSAIVFFSDKRIEAGGASAVSDRERDAKEKRNRITLSLRSWLRRNAKKGSETTRALKRQESPTAETSKDKEAEALSLSRPPVSGERPARDQNLTTDTTNPNPEKESSGANINQLATPSARCSLQQLERDIEIKNQKYDHELQRASQPGAVFVSNIEREKSISSLSQSFEQSENGINAKSNLQGVQRSSPPGAVSINYAESTNASKLNIPEKVDSKQLEQDLKMKSAPEGQERASKPGAVYVNEDGIRSSHSDFRGMENDVEAKVREQEREEASQPGAVWVGSRPPGTLCVADAKDERSISSMNNCLRGMENDVETKIREQQGERASQPGIIRVEARQPALLSIPDAKNESRGSSVRSCLKGVEREIEVKMREQHEPEQASQPGAIWVGSKPPGTLCVADAKDERSIYSICNYLERMESDVETKIRKQQNERSSQIGAIRVEARQPASLSISDAKNETIGSSVRCYLKGVERHIEIKMRDQQERDQVSQPGAIWVGSRPPGTLCVADAKDERSISSMDNCLRGMENDVEMKIREQHGEHASHPGAIRIEPRQPASLMISEAKHETDGSSGRSCLKRMEEDIEIKIREQQERDQVSQPGAAWVGTLSIAGEKSERSLSSMNNCLECVESDVERKIREQQLERASQPGAKMTSALQLGTIPARSCLTELESDTERKMRDQDCLFQHPYGRQPVNGSRRSSLEILERDIEAKMHQQSIVSSVTNIEGVKSTTSSNSSSSMLDADAACSLSMDPRYALIQLERRVEQKVRHMSGRRLSAPAASAPDACETLHETLPVIEPFQMNGAPSSLTSTVKDKPSETFTSIDDLTWSFPVFGDPSTAEEDGTQVLQEELEAPSTVRGIISVVACTADSVLDAAVQGIVEEGESEKETQHLYNRCKRATLCAGIVIVVVTLFSVLLEIFVRRSDEVPDPMEYGTDAPTITSTTELFSSFVDILTPLSGLAAFQDSSSPQYKALDWLYEDYQIANDDVIIGNEKFLQRYILAVFYFSTGGDSWVSCNRRAGGNCFLGGNSWLTHTDECTWFAISCNDEGSIIKLHYINAHPYESQFEIRLNNIDGWFMSVRGVLPQEFRSLHDLTSFKMLEYSQLEGDISSCFSGMRKLETISLPKSRFSGTLSASIDVENPSLVEIDLADNQLSGPIPASIKNLTALRVLRFTNNQLTGTIPPDLGSLVQLETLDLLNNQLSGSVPLSLYNDRLTVMKLGWNKLQGEIKSVISRMTALRSLDLGNSLMGGELPPELFRLPELIELRLPNANFEGTLSEDFSFLNQTIRDVILSGNNFVGSIPEAFNYCTILEELDLSNNPQLVGSISDALCQQRGTREGALRLLQVDCAIDCTCCGLRQTCDGGGGSGSN